MLNLDLIGALRWGVFGNLQDHEDIHVCPMFGREHELEDDCWCHPEENFDGIMVHNVEQ